MSKLEIYILGNGAMASAMACGLKEARLDSGKLAFSVHVVGRSEKALDPLKEAGFITHLYKDFDLTNKRIILGIKPYALDDICELLGVSASDMALKNLQKVGRALTGSKDIGKDKRALYVISPLAGMSLEALRVLPAMQYARIMPNIAARFGASTTPYILGQSALGESSDAKKLDAEIVSIIKGFGTASALANEAQMEGAMVLSGCTPAYFAIIAEALMNAGVYEGLSVSMSSELVSSAFASMAALLKSGMHPSAIKEGVCSPAGTTIKGVRVLEEAGIRGSIYKAVDASAKNKN